ncbi:metallophosphoesterase [Mycetocola reblochoni]|uniref:Metallophosphoesterase n=2 Tax=Mycetocola reblochoni TaxID=331618 RepID=A0A3L6ZS79_9MICO|nr:metallophosphoesterase [Mycetocola reblochoni]RLP70669.1 metallophosphoesterase [Mycetocola reblochoni]SJN32742.1 putative secreted protein [Mycetocola reblochoni REB411]
MAANRLVRGVGSAVLATAVAGAAAFAWGSLVERRLFTVRRYEVAVLPPGAEPIRVLHLSDLHMAPWQRDKQEWVAGLIAERPDLVVDTGDNLGHVDGIGGIEKALTPFAGTPGMFVNGSNDYFSPLRKNWLRYFTAPSSVGAPARTPDLDIERMNRFFAAGLGWTDLNNAATSLTVRGTRLVLFGVDDPHIGLDRLDRVPVLLDELEESLAEDDHDVSDLVRIGVAHAPYQRVLNSFVTNGAELILAGHTHGGQVCVPGIGALVANCDIPRRQASGLSSWRHARRSAKLHVSAGIGTSIYAPVRFACRPEAAMITLVAR